MKSSAVDDFFQDVQNIVDIQLQQGILAFQQDLEKLSSTKGYKIPPELIAQACQKLQEKLKYCYYKNLEKFQKYSLRNIFVSRRILEQNQQKHEANSSESHVDSKDIDKEIDSLVQEYSELINQKDHFSDECEILEGLLGQIQRSQFNLMLISQQQEQHELHANDSIFKEPAKILKEVEVQISELMRNCDDTISQIQSTNNLNQYDNHDYSYGCNIITHGTKDLQLLNRALQHH